MTLSAADVAEIMRLVEQSTFDELTLEIDGVKLTLRRGAAAGVAATGATAAGAASLAAVQGAPGQSAAGAGAAAQSLAGQAVPGQGAGLGERFAQGSTAGSPSAALAGAGQNTAANSAATRSDVGAGGVSARSAPLDANVHEIPSPLLGTFYRSPKPGAAPFVDVGTVVHEDTTVAIIEVMKLMNTVRAGVRGTVTEVLVSDGALVEFEQPLLRVRKAG